MSLHGSRLIEEALLYLDIEPPRRPGLLDSNLAHGKGGLKPGSDETRQDVLGTRGCTSLTCVDPDLRSR